MNTLDWLPILNIQDGVTELKDGRYIKLVEVAPVNFYLKSALEQERIISTFAAYLKVAQDKLQIRVLTQKADLDAVMNRMWAQHDAEDVPACRAITENEVCLLNALSRNQTLQRRFFLVFQNCGAYNDAIATLERNAMNAAVMLEDCGLSVEILDDSATQLVFAQIINKQARQYISLSEYYFGEDISHIAPNNINLSNKRHIVIDGVYHTMLYIAGYGYPSKVFAGWLSFLADAGEGVSISFFLERQRKDKILGKISQTTMFNRSRMREVDDTRSDFEQLESAIFAGMYLKDGMNRQSQDFYYMNTLIEVSAENLDLLERRVDAVKTLCTANNYVAKRADYRHEQAFLSCLPTLSPDPLITRKSRRNILTDSAAASFPFCGFELFDQYGVLLGQNLYNSSVALLDVFDSRKYSNANMCVMGTSGAGKTYLLQLLALRHRCQGTRVFIIAPLKGHEFKPACDAIGGKYIKLSPASEECINIMEIRNEPLPDKIQKLHIFFTLMKPNITHEERNILDNALVETYKRNPAPCLADLYAVLGDNPDARFLRQSLSRFVTGSAKRLGGQTNVDLSNKYVVLDVSELSGELLPMGMFLALDYVWDTVKRERREKKIVFLDELWHLIGASSTSLAAKYVVEIFKTIRGYGGSAVGATQDLNDFFTLDNGDYGKGVLGNSRIKIIMQMEEDEAARVQKLLSLSDEEAAQIIRFKRGQGLLCTGHIRTTIGFSSSEEEFNLINTERTDVH
ncbi:hypothetical protein FACS1894208_05140 [Clostridia bacterium]|nr:hypothetical protein FACS1894208_05140 [Clostridia bacterium]